MKPVWRKIVLDSRELRISTVLRCGQSFRWRENEEGVWSVGYKGRVILLQQDDKNLHYASLPVDDVDIKDVIDDYFNLKTSLKDLYTDWAEKDAHFKKMTLNQLAGIRILRQDPWETLCSFICSSNNNIKRISQMVENLSIHYGDFIANYNDVDYYDFPSPDRLADKAVEGKLRDLGFGYRAKYIQRTAELITSKYGGQKYVDELRTKPYLEAREALLEFTGVGPKVADCVCLMGLDKNEVVPVDTHVWQIAQRDYKVAKKYKTLNKVAYEEVRDHFKVLWGDYAGWAHSVLFTADLNLEEQDIKKEESAEQTPTSKPTAGIKRELDEPTLELPAKIPVKG